MDMSLNIYTHIHVSLTYIQSYMSLSIHKCIHMSFNIYKSMHMSLSIHKHIDMSLSIHKHMHMSLSIYTRIHVRLFEIRRTERAENHEDRQCCQVCRSGRPTIFFCFAPEIGNATGMPERSRSTRN